MEDGKALVQCPCCVFAGQGWDTKPPLSCIDSEVKNGVCVLSIIIKEKGIFHWSWVRDSTLQVCCGEEGRGGDWVGEAAEVGESLLMGQASLGGNLGGGCGGQVSGLGSPGCLYDLQSPLLEVSWDLQAHTLPCPWGCWEASFWVAEGLGSFSPIS